MHWKAKRRIGYWTPLILRARWWVSAQEAVVTAIICTKGEEVSKPVWIVHYTLNQQWFKHSLRETTKDDLRSQNVWALTRQMPQRDNFYGFSNLAQNSWTYFMWAAEPFLQDMMTQKSQFNSINDNNSCLEGCFILSGKDPTTIEGLLLGSLIIEIPPRFHK